MSRYWCVFDFETDGKNPETCSPVELACIMLDPYTLDIVEGSEFHSDMRPDGILDINEYMSNKERVDTINWHCKLRQCTVDDLLNKWIKSPDTKTVWEMFAKHISKYNKLQTQWGAPYAAGMNIKNFDLIIAKRLNDKFKIPRMFNYEICDLRDLAFYWLIWETELRSRSMDSLRERFELSTANAHTALADVIEEANLISRFLKFHKTLYHKHLRKTKVKKDVIQSET